MKNSRPATFARFGKEIINVRTNLRMLGIALMLLRGLIALRDLMEEKPLVMLKVSRIAVITTMKSSTFHAFLR